MSVAVADEQGLTASSPPIAMEVTQGDLSVPDDISASGALGGFLRTLLIILLILGALALLAFLLLRSGVFKRRDRSSPQALRVCRIARNASNVVDGVQFLGRVLSSECGGAHATPRRS